MSSRDEPTELATIDPPRAIRVKTSTGWADLAIQGAPGADGTDGAAGPAGPPGPQGIQGPVGPAGTAELPPRLSEAGIFIADAEPTGWNIATTPGYWWSGTTANSPAPGYWVQGHVSVGNNGVTQQVWARDLDMAWWRRRDATGAWSAWMQTWPVVAALPARLGPTGCGVPANDWNQALENGWYMAIAATNQPVADGGWWLGEVFVHNSDWVTQRAWAFVAGAGSTVYERRKLNGAWTAWVAIGGAGAGAGAQLAYTEFQGTVTATGTSEAGAAMVVSAGAVAFDGATRVKLEFFAPSGMPDNNNPGDQGVVALFDGSAAAPLGRIGSIGRSSVVGQRYFTPSGGTHTYLVGIYDSGTASSRCQVSGGGGGANALVPGFIRITKA